MPTEPAIAATDSDGTPATTVRWPRLLDVVWVVVTVVAGFVAAAVVSLETHFDCGGTFGGYGESATARLDEGCVDDRAWRVPMVMVAIAASSAGVGLALRRLRRDGSVSGAVPVLAALAALAGAWALGVTLFVTV